MPLFGLDFKDDNGNQWPEIYSRAFNPTSFEPFHRQVNAFLGLQQVDPSAYLKNSVLPSSYYYPSLSEKISRMLSELTNLSGTQKVYDVVFVWDIGDITMLTKSHFDELQLLRPDINLDSLYNLRERICDDVNNSVESVRIKRKVVNIEDAIFGETRIMKEAAPLYKALQKIYYDIQSNFVEKEKHTISHDLLEKLGMLDQKNSLCEATKKHQKIYNQRWKYAKRCMELVNTRSAKSKTRKYANVVLCDEGVATGAAQLILAGLSSTTPIENVYSTSCPPGASILRQYRKMESVIERIQQRFGENCILVHVTSGPKYVGLPIIYWHVKANESIKLLYDFQRDLLQ